MGRVIRSKKWISDLRCTYHIYPKPKEEVDHKVCSNPTPTRELLLQNSEFWTTPKEMGIAKFIF